MTFMYRCSTSLLILLLAMLSPTLFAKVEIDGVNSTLEKNIRAFLSISKETCDAPSWRLQQRRRQVEEQTMQALQAYGYYQPSVRQRFEQKKDCWLLELDVSAGPQVKLRDIDIQIRNQPEDIHPQLQQLLQKPSLKSGDVLNHQNYDSYKSQLLDAAHNWGYWQASFERAQLAIYPEQLAADVHLHFRIGPRYRFGAYSFAETVLDDDLIARLVEPLESEYYSLDRIQDSYRRLQNSGYFRQVVVSPTIPDDKSNTTVPLHVSLAMNPRHNFGAGVGFSTDQGSRVHGNYRNRYLNGAGHHLRSGAVWSDKLQQVSGTYTIPREDAAREWYEISAGFMDEETSAYTAINRSVNIRAITQLTNRWVMNTGINHLRERYIVADQDERKTTLFVPGIGFSWANVDDSPRQQSGLRFESGITVSDGAWFSSEDYIQAYTRTKAIYSPTKRLRLISRFELAGTVIDSVENLPATVRYFAGGDSSVRGYAYKSLGSLDDEGNVVGGSNLTVASVELDYLIFKNWSLSTFYDMGDAYNEQPDYKSAQGVGIRWYSPVGALRLDFAFPNHSDEDYRIHISIGADL